MENIEFIQILAFSLVAYLFGFSAGQKVGYIAAVKAMPITILKLSNDLTLEEQDEK